MSHAIRILTLALAAVAALAAAEPAAKPRPIATATSHQGGNEPDQAIDGQGTTLWHSRWGEPRAALPQALTIDQGQVETVGSVMYQPRPDGGNGTVTKYNLALSSDGKEFTTVVKDGQWPADNKRKVVSFPAVQARYVRLEVLEGVGGFASVAELVVAPTPIDPTVNVGMVAVLAPAYGADIQGDTPLSISAPGFAAVTVSCWKQGPGFGSEATVGTATLDAAGKGALVFPANDFPRGPICVRLAAAKGTLRDTCWLQLYNRGGGPG
jgi:hypothetical protein